MSGMDQKEYILTASQMQRFDKNTIEHIGIPSAVLMERAALGVTEEITKRYPRDKKVLVVAGKGNNGGDGLAIARLLLLLGYKVDTYLAWDQKMAGTEENIRQLTIFKNVGGSFVAEPRFDAYDVIVDALFGIGLTGPLKAPYCDLVEQINGSGTPVVAVDIPSGLDADTGTVSGSAVRADITVTFGYRKKAHVLDPACTFCGQVILCDVGIYHNPTLFEELYCFTGKPCLPRRNPFGNKGTFGKLFILAGSKEIAGAAILAAQAAFAMGIGMVKLLIHKNQKEAILQCLPECMVQVYDDRTTITELKHMLESAVKWCDGILIGPGIGTGIFAKQMVTILLEEQNQALQKPMVMDADALNILSEAGEPLLSKVITYTKPIVMTPHLGEFGRLCKESVSELKKKKESLARGFADTYHCTVVCKDARTIVVSRDQKEAFINTTGNDGMACAGSGDVLAGMLGVLLIQSDTAFQAAYQAVALHGMAGDRAAGQLGKRSMRASDMVCALRESIFKMDHNEQ